MNFFFGGGGGEEGSKIIFCTLAGGFLEPAAVCAVLCEHWTWTQRLKVGVLDPYLPQWSHDLPTLRQYGIAVFQDLCPQSITDSCNITLYMQITLKICTSFQFESLILTVNIFLHDLSEIHASLLIRWFCESVILQIYMKKKLLIYWKYNCVFSS